MASHVCKTDKRQGRSGMMTAVFAVCLTAAALLTGRPHLLYSTRSLCERSRTAGSDCRPTGGLRSAEALLQAAAQHVVVRHQLGLGLGAVQQVQPPAQEQGGSPVEDAVEVALQQQDSAAETATQHPQRQQDEGDYDSLASSPLAGAAPSEEASQPSSAVESQLKVDSMHSSTAKESARVGGTGGDANSSSRPPSPYQLALHDCQDLPCLSRAAKLERAPGQFRFPHAFIVGWQKCATTSLYWHLNDHPQVLTSKAKEPEFFSYECGYDPGDCPKAAQRQYILETLRLPEALEHGLVMGALEASTHYGRNGEVLAKPLSKVFPWLKVVISLREPISRAMSMLAHLLDKHDKGCMARSTPYQCLRTDLAEGGYAGPLRAWLDAYPTGQVKLVQYENLTSSANQGAVLRELKSFLGIDPDVPHSELAARNTREDHLLRKGQLEEGEEAGGWPMKRWQYQELVQLVRQDTLKVADLVVEHGLADGVQWLANWEAEWQATLDSCAEDGSCVVHPN